MECALIENGIVINMIWVDPGSASAFPEAVPVGDIMVNIGDSYEDGVFYRDGQRVLTTIEEVYAIADEKIAELDAALLEITYENIIGGLE